MADNDCEVSVFKNGTMMRWTGERAERIWSGMQTADGEYFSLGIGPLDRDNPSLAPTVTKPIRKVTEIEGSFKIGPGEREQLLVHADGKAPMEFFWLDTLLPREVVEAGRDKHHRVRVTVEAEAVEEKVR